MNRIDRLLSNLSIGRRLQALVLVPLLGLLVFPVMAAVRDYNTFTQAARIGEIVALEPEINSFVHDLQKERGITTGYIASNWSAPFHERLQAQWPATDETRARLRQALDSFDSASFGTGVSEPAALVRARIAELESVRRRVRARDLSESENLRYYTALIDALLDIVTQIGVLNEQPELFDIASAYIAILEIEERAGLERAIGTIGFSYGYFTPPVHEQYLDLIHTEKDFGEIFDRHAPPDLRGSLAEARSGTGFAKVRRLRNVAIENGYGVPVEDVTAAMWFDAATQMVDQLIEVKAATSLRLRDTVAQLHATAREGFVYTIALTALVLAVVLSLVALVVRSITGPLASLENVMGELAQGKHAVAVAGTDRRDEVGAMARMVEVFRKRLIERQAQRELLRDNQIKLARLERQLEKASRASTAGEVSTALAHELNQPLASVVNYLDACRQYLTSSAPEAKDELPKLFDRATEQAGRAAGIVKGVRRFVRKDGLVQVPHDINQIVREIADVVLSSSDADRVALHLDLAEDLPPAMIDKVQIQQIVMNLIQNAVDAMYYADHPQLSITTSMDSNDQVLLTVSDNGRGLAAEVRANLFEPFVTTKPDGMGLGLTVGKSIAELHDGNLTAESDAGGTTFRLTLPRTPDAR